MVRMTYCGIDPALFVWVLFTSPLGPTTKGRIMSGRPIKRPC